MTEDFVQLLKQLGDESRPLRTLSLGRLSDLTRAQLIEFREMWELISPGRRFELVSAMVEQAEANIHLNFHAILRASLSDEDPRVRKAAIEGLWEDEKPNLVQPLASLVSRDPSPEVRAAAALSLGRFVLMGVLGEISQEPAHLAEQTLRDAWYRGGETTEVRRRALESLAYSNLPGLHEQIGSAYYDEDAAMRQSAVFSMGRNADPRWSKYVLAELSSHEPAMRYEAATAAGEMSLKAAVSPLIGLLDDADSTVREAATMALGKIGGPVAKRALQALMQSEDEALAQAAEEALDELTFNSDQLDDLLMDYSPAGGKVRAGRQDAEGEVDDLESMDGFLEDAEESDDLYDEDELDEDDEDWDEGEEEDELEWEDEDEDDRDWR